MSEALEKIPVTMHLPSIWLEQLKTLARHRASRENKDIHWADLVREAVDSYLASSVEGATNESI